MRAPLPSTESTERDSVKNCIKIKIQDSVEEEEVEGSIVGSGLSRLSWITINCLHTVNEEPENCFNFAFGSRKDTEL